MADNQVPPVKKVAAKPPQGQKPRKSRPGEHPERTVPKPGEEPPRASTAHERPV
ncbi:MAG: hypothetical protein QOF11_2739 [Chloroflexota bacterium]|jgi:hypothetical protein|nr:hypothetical protein [Chloroflexota bacterium]